jgi:hypothetical protein
MVQKRGEKERGANCAMYLIFKPVGHEASSKPGSAYALETVISVRRV